MHNAKCVVSSRPRPWLGLAAVCAASIFSLPSSFAQDATATPDETVKLPTFEVSTNQDKGYLASNSVSASRVDTPIADLPFSITAITSQFIQDTGALDLYDIVSYAAGVRSGSTAFTGGSNNFMIRGFGQTPEHDGFFESSEGNDFTDPVNIERVEVVKGPASLLYGTISPGGTINYITKRPEDQAFGDIAVSAGSYNFLRTTLDVNQPLVDKTLLFRINAAWQNNYQYVLPSRDRQTAVDPDLTWKATSNLTIKLSYQRLDKRGTPNVAMIPEVEISTPQSVVNALNGSLGYPGTSALLANKTSVDYLAGYNDSSDPGSLSLVGSNGWPRRMNYESDNDWYRASLQSFNGEADLVLGDHWVARANFDYNANTNKQLVTGISTFDTAPPGSMVYTAGSGWSVAPSWNALTTAQQLAAGLAYAQEIMDYPGVVYQGGQPLIDPRRERYSEVYGHDDTVQVEASGSYKYPWVTLKPLAGVYYDNNYSTTQQWQDAGTAASPYFQAWDANPLSPTYYVNYNTYFSPTALTAHTTNTLGFTTDKAAYGMLNASFLQDRLFLIAGARYSETHSQVTNYLSASGSSAGYFHYTTPEVGLGYKVLPDLMLYGSYSTSYTPPSTPVLTGLATVNGIPTSVPTGTAAPTTGVGYETGLKSSFLNGRISSTLSVYQIDQTNLVQTVQEIVSGSTISQTFQGTEIRSRGVEYEITYSPLDNLQIFFSATEDDVRYIEEPVGYAYYLGSHPWNTGKNMENVWSRYGFDGALKGLWFGTGFQYTGKSALVSNDINEFTPAFIVWNAAAGYDWTWNKRKFSASLHWENINNSGDYITAYERGLPDRVMGTIEVRF